MAKAQTKSPDLPPARKTATMLKIESEHGKDIRLVIIDLYSKHGGLAQVAKQLNVSVPCISLWCARLGIIFRSVAEISQ